MRYWFGFHWCCSGNFNLFNYKMPWHSKLISWHHTTYSRCMI